MRDKQKEQSSEDQNQRQENGEEPIIDDDIGIEDDSALLKAIDEKIIAVDDEEKLTWSAIYNLKKKDKDLREQMNKEMDDIRKKFQKLRNPLLISISKAALGVKLEENSYLNENVKKINLSKTAPRKIEDYWLVSLGSTGLLNEHSDPEVIQACGEIVCELGEEDYRVAISWKDNQYCQEMSCEMSIKQVDNKIQRNIVKAITKYKKAVRNDSLFTKLFDESIDPQITWETTLDLFKVYMESPFFYLNQHNIESQSQDEDDDDSEVEGVPKKKTKSESLQKPQCKQQ